jgi:hypothetical protein
LSVYIRKSLALGPIRFGVTTRHGGTLPPADLERGFSTGPNGEYRRLGKGSMFFADSRGLGKGIFAPPKPEDRSLLEALRPEDAKGWGRIALMVLGLFLVLIGLLVTIRLGKQGLIEIVLGLGIIATPVVTTWKKLQVLRAAAAKERAEIEAIEARNRAMVGELATAIALLETSHDDATLAEIRRVRSGKDVPYEAFSPLAKTAVLRVGFQLLTGATPAGPAPLAQTMDRISDTVGLTPEDKHAVKLYLYQTVLWHLLADDRLTDAREERLHELRAALALQPQELERDEAAVAEFRRLRGVDTQNLPQYDCDLPLQFQELCYHKTSGSAMKQKFETVKSAAGLKRREERWEQERPCDVFVTNKRLQLESKKPAQVPLPRIYDVEVDYDANVVGVTTGLDPKKPFYLSLPDPIYTAAVLDIASALAADPTRL